MGEVLSGMDYVTKPYLELVGHPDFSQKAFERVSRITRMTSRELEKLNFFDKEN